MKKNHPKSSAGRPKLNSELLGQVFTPQDIAARMAQLLLQNYKGNKKVRILDPSVGPATFPKELFNKIENDYLELTVFDIDPSMIIQTNEWASSHSINMKYFSEDYLEADISGTFDYAIFNPPYVRQEWIDKKKIYQEKFLVNYGIKVPGTSNLYVYFMVKVIQDLKPGGSFVCIIYDSWQSTLYGRWLVEYINEECETVNVEQFTNQPFENTLIDATIITGIKKSSNKIKAIKGQKLLEKPKSPLTNVSGFKPLGTIYETRRGLRLKQTNFFMCDYQQFNDIAIPFVKKVNKIKGFKVENNHPEGALLVTKDNVNPKILEELNCRLSIAKLNKEKNKSILNWYEERPETWFLHPTPPYADIIFNYYIRNRPKHILNLDKAYSDNFYGLNVKEGLSKFACLATLNSTVVCNEILFNARNQGNGLNKIQLFEYREVLVPDLTQLSEKEIEAFHCLGLKLIQNNNLEETIKQIDWLIYRTFSHEVLKPLD